jgi:3-deoxy-manno-octulosonate cytidylyltransferase (CMP-KDO synthetase)
VKIVGIIPARYGASRFPGKPLARIAGKPMIQHVIERCQQAHALAEVMVATDDTRIWEVAAEFCQAEITARDHPSGLARVAEVAARSAADAFLNIHTDEPLLAPAVIDAVAGALEAEEMATAATPLREAAQLDDPNVVKVVVNAAGRALYFSRRAIPYLSEAASRSVGEPLAAFPFLRQLGIYGYRRRTLLRLAQLPVSPLEAAEQLEALRALEHGIPMAVVRAVCESLRVDVPADVARVERRLRGLDASD